VRLVATYSRATWPDRAISSAAKGRGAQLVSVGAGDGDRTRDFNLGKKRVEGRIRNPHFRRLDLFIGESTLRSIKDELATDRVVINVRRVVTLSVAIPSFVYTLNQSLSP